MDRSVSHECVTRSISTRNIFMGTAIVILPYNSLQLSLMVFYGNKKKTEFEYNGLTTDNLFDSLPAYMKSS